MKIQDRVHYLQHPLADIWTGVTLLDGERLAIVDSATRTAVNETILPYLTGQRLYRGQPVLVVNTHCHCDHIGGNAGLKQTLQATIAAHQADQAFIEQRLAQFEALFGPFEGFAGLAMARTGFFNIAGADTPVDLPLSDGQRLELGRFTFNVLHTPGHTAGSICLYEPHLGLLLTGDSVQGEGTTDTQAPMIVDLAAYRQSMQRLAGLEISLLIADHPFKPHPGALFYGSAARAFILESLAAAETFLNRTAQWASAASQPFSLIELGTHLAPQAGLEQPNPYLMILAAACLDELEREGLVQRLSGQAWQPDGTFMPRD